ncbi:MAG: serine/threonine protein kinase [Devosia sp.]|uniref:serine/threonine-protein kinase n=1 Tax=Devosia sp. TaxID=1871048 RepID=UPI001ACFFEE0|nr:serine/threonine-protein kinase [Devosia sp.]MBN9317892.1 serine/threonine protein kinase [Devosia sp.]
MLKPYNKAELTFDILREIGQDGRNSRVFVVHDHQLNAEIVAKQIEKAKIADINNLFEESKALYASSHPNVVQIHYACFDADYVYLAMPYYRRGSVKSLITGKWMTVREIIVIAAQMLSGLHNIHSKRLVHFDIKPDNILLSDRGEALVSDFGQAKQMNFSGIAGQDRLYNKMQPPEAFGKDQFDNRFDIYQVGLTLYRMCNGNEAFYEQFNKYTGDRDAFRMAVKQGNFPDRKAFASHVPSKLRKVIRRCLEVDPTARYGSAIEITNALADIDGAELDWRLQSHPDKKVWSKNESGTTYSLSVYADGRSELYKSVNGGDARRVLDGCRDGIAEKDLQKLLGSY